MRRVLPRLFKLQGFKEGDSPIFLGPRESLGMGGVGKAPTGWVVLGMEVQTHLLSVIRKATPLRLLLCRGKR